MYLNTLLFSSIIIIVTEAFLTSILKQIDIPRPEILLVLFLGRCKRILPVVKHNVAVPSKSTRSVVDEVHVLYVLIEGGEEILDIVFVDIVGEAFTEEGSIVFGWGVADISLSSLASSSVTAIPTSSIFLPSISSSTSSISSSPISSSSILSSIPPITTTTSSVSTSSVSSVSPITSSSSVSSVSSSEASSSSSSLPLGWLVVFVEFDFDVVDHVASVLVEKVLELLKAHFE